MQPIYLVPLGHSAIPVQIGLVGHGPAYYLQIAATDRNLKLLLKASPRVTLETFEPLLDDIRATLGDLPPGIIRAEAEREQIYHLLSVADIRPELPDARKLALLIERFRDSPADIYEALLADYKTLTGQAYDAENGQSQLESDLAAVSPLAPELLDAEGQLVWGGQSRIAEALDIPNAGQSNRARILAVVEALRRAA